MEPNEMEPRTRDERRQALQEFQWGHDEMRGAIAIGRFELEDDVAGRGMAQAFVAQGGAGDVAAQAFKFLVLLGATLCVGMQAKPLGTDTAFLLRCLVIGQAQRGVFPGQHFLSCSGPRAMCCMLVKHAIWSNAYLTMQTRPGIPAVSHE